MARERAKKKEDFVEDAIENDNVVNEEIEDVDEELLNIIEDAPTKDVVAVNDTFTATLNEGNNEEVKDPPVLRPLPLIRWKKIGGGSFRLKNKMIKPGQIFTANKDDIPKQFLSSLVQLDDVADTENVVEIKSNYSIVKIEDTETYNIVDSFGKVLNEQPLSAGDAKFMLKAFSA